MQWIIRDNAPFKGHCLSTLNNDDTVAYSDGLTLAEYEQREGYKLRVIEDDEFFALVDAHENTLKTKPTPITEQRFWDMLEVLPPCRWHNVGGFEVFHVSERLTGNLVSWFAQRNGNHWEFTDNASLPSADLAAMLREAA